MHNLSFSRPAADVYVPNGDNPITALSRVTHLAIGAHQDDLEIMAYAGIAECHQRTDKRFGGVVVTDGGGSPRLGAYGEYSDEEMKAVRLLEQRKAAMVGDYAIQIQLAHPSAAVKDAKRPEPVEDLARILAGCRPRTVYLHNPADRHDTHIAVLRCCLAALRRLPPNERPAQVYGCEVWRDLDWADGQDVVALPADRMPHLAAALVGLFDSQIAGGKRYDLATAGRRLANATYRQSHHTDDCPALTLAMDLTPLVRDDSLDLETFTLRAVDRFRADVQDRLRRLAPAVGS